MGEIKGTYALKVTVIARVTGRHSHIQVTEPKSRPVFAGQMAPPTGLEPVDAYRASTLYVPPVTTRSRLMPLLISVYSPDRARNRWPNPRLDWTLMQPAKVTQSHGRGYWAREETEITTVTTKARKNATQAMEGPVTRPATAPSAVTGPLAAKRQFGTITRLPSGNYRARYTDEQGVQQAAPRTFQTRLDAGAWLDRIRTDMSRGVFKQAPPVRGSSRGSGEPQFGEYALQTFALRSLKPRTREHYEQILTKHLALLHDLPLRAITTDVIAHWYINVQTGPTMKSHAYSLVRTIMNHALNEDKIDRNPCRIPRAGKVKRASKTTEATLDEIGTIIATMPDRYAALVLISTWCALRFGESTALRRKDISADGRTLHVRRGTVRVGKEIIEQNTTKGGDGGRDVAVPPHVVPFVLLHLDRYAEEGRNGLLFPSETGGTFLSSSTLYRYYHPARDAAGRSDLRWHDLRHTGATMAAREGATTADLMARLGHSTSAAAMAYQHTSRSRDRVIADRLSEAALAGRS